MLNKYYEKLVYGEVNPDLNWIELKLFILRAFIFTYCKILREHELSNMNSLILYVLL